MSEDNEPNIRTLIQLFVLIFGGFGFLFFLGCWTTGRCDFQADSIIIEMGICLNQTTYKRTQEISLDGNDIYLCGRIEGTTSRPGRLYLFQEDTVVHNTGFDQKPGIFSIPLPMNKLQPGHNYKVEIGYAKEVLAEVEFIVKSEP